jgi:hypothetical protein
MKEWVKKTTAGVLAAIYITAMHPMLAYGESGGAMAPGIIYFQKVAEEAAVMIEAEGGGTVRLGEAEVEIPSGDPLRGAGT